MWLTRAEAIAQYGEYPGSRSMEKLLSNGIVILDKWRGPTSHDVTAAVKKLLGISKAGHSGTLDPQVSGVLPIALGSATKSMPLLQRLDKEYAGVMKLHKDVSAEKLREAAKRFVGTIEQLPPLRSAVRREKRKRTVHSFDIIEKDGRTALFSISCEAGTYVRKVIHDLGLRIGGAHMSELRRTAVGCFTEARAVKMQHLAAAYYAWRENGDETLREYVLPAEAAAENAKKVIVKDSAVYSIARGSPLYAGGIAKAEAGIAPGDRVALLTLRGELAAIGIAALTSERMVKGRSMACRTDRVLIDITLYPKME